MRLKFSIVFTALLALALSAGTADAQKRGGVLKFATPSVKPGLDPARTRTGDAYMLTGMIFSNLTRISHELKPEPQLAHKWEASADSSEWTFHLVKNAKFHNGLRKSGWDPILEDHRVTAKPHPSVGAGADHGAFKSYGVIPWSRTI